MKQHLVFCLLLATAMAGAQNATPGSHAARNAIDANAPMPVSTAAQVTHMQAMLRDWPDLARYRVADAALPPPARGENRVVFMGDSITDAWGRDVGTFFPGKPYINRGISGQTTPQMLVRFRQDVIALQPKAVLILAGTNDIAGNTGPSTPQMIEDNLVSMTQLAKANGIRVVLSSILPAAQYPWRPGIDPVAKIRTLNGWMRNYCAANDCVYLDYYSAMNDGRGGMKAALTLDGVHPNAAGYAVMTPLAETAIATALAKP